MSRELTSDEKGRVNRSKSDEAAKAPDKHLDPTAAGLLSLQQKVGNQAVQRLIAQRNGGESGFDLDEDTSNRINQARGSGQALDGAVQKQMSQSMGFDFSGVRVHTSSESDTLNQELGAKAFTTGQDVFFKQGAYNPGSSDGKELIAHELTHVVQQNTGRVGGGGGGMTVRPAGDAFEQEADAVAKAMTSGSSATAEGGVQRQEIPEEEEPVQMQELPEEEEEVQMQEMPEEEEEVAQKHDIQFLL